jgi:hypothetical protein
MAKRPSYYKTAAIESLLDVLGIEALVDTSSKLNEFSVWPPLSLNTHFKIAFKYSFPDVQDLI